MLLVRPPARSSQFSGRPIVLVPTNNRPAGFSYFNTQRALQEQINLGINNAANRQANRIHTAYEESMAKLQVFPTSIAVNRAMAAYLATPNKANQDVLNETLDDTHRFDTAYRQLNVLSPEGVVIGSTNPPMLGKSFADTTVFERGRDTMDASVFFKDSGNGQYGDKGVQ